MEEELKERLEILFGRFLNNEEEFTIGYLKQAVELSGKVCNLFLKIHNFFQEKIREGLVVNTGRKEQGGFCSLYIKRSLPVSHKNIQSHSRNIPDFTMESGTLLYFR